MSIQIPSLTRLTDTDRPSFRVVHPGRAAGMDLAAGDLLILGDPPGEGDLVVLVPRGYGRPMLGRVVGGALVAEPGGVRCDPRRWEAAGRLVLHMRGGSRGAARPPARPLPPPPAPAAPSVQLGLFSLAG